MENSVSLESSMVIEPIPLIKITIPVIGAPKVGKTTFINALTFKNISNLDKDNYIPTINYDIRILNLDGEILVKFYDIATSLHSPTTVGEFIKNNSYVLFFFDRGNTHSVSYFETIGELFKGCKIICVFGNQDKPNLVSKTSSLFKNKFDNISNCFVSHFDICSFSEESVTKFKQDFKFFLKEQCQKEEILKEINQKEEIFWSYPEIVYTQKKKKIEKIHCFN